MKIPPLPHVECAILHKSFRPMDGRKLLGAIQQLSAKHGFGSDCNLMFTSTEKDIHVLAGQHRVLVSQNPQPLGPEGFATALATPFTGMAFPDARAAVEGHRANTFVTVGKGPVAIPEDILGSEVGGMIAEMSAFTTSEEAERARQLCIDLSMLVMKSNPASAVHWCISDNLLPQATFEMMAASDDHTMLDIRPYFTSSSGRMGEGLPLGVMGHGSQWLLGKMVSIEEAPVPPQVLLQLLYGFVNICMVRGSLIPHMDTFGIEGHDLQVAVFHEEIEGFDRWELVRLEILHHPEFGIIGRAPTKQQYAYKSVEDVRRRAQEEQAEARGAAAAGAAGGRAQSEMARLRNLAVASAANQQREAAKPSPGLMSRFRSLLPGKLH